MRNAVQSGLTLLALLLCATVAPAHYHILLLDKHSVKKDESVTLLYRWGHPFEHQLFDAPAPKRMIVIAPDGKITELTEKLEKLKQVTPDKKEVTAYQLKFIPDQRGDYTFVMHAPPIFLEEDGEFVLDVVKVVLHVQAQKHWDAEGLPMTELRMIPLTRPYGLQPDMVFQAIFDGYSLYGRGMEMPPKQPGYHPFAKALVEIERYNAMPPKKLPPDEHITRTVKTDSNGIVTCTLTTPGWWCVTGISSSGKRKHNGKDYPVRQRATLWVHVDEKITGN